jgi:hypothetical protein
MTLISTLYPAIRSHFLPVAVFGVISFTPHIDENGSTVFASDDIKTNLPI